MAENPSKICVVTPSFNHGRYIEAAVRSVLDQDYPNLEYWVIDGGSKDGTVDILKSFTDPRLHWISEPDGGQSDALNKGYSRGSGEILGWLNSDDTHAPGALSAAAEFFKTHPQIGVVYGNADFIDSCGNFICHCAHIEPFNRHRLVHYTDFIVQPAAFFRREVLQSVGGMDASLNFAMDYDLFLKAAEKTEFAYLPRVLANFRWLDDCKTAVGGWKRLREIEGIAKRNGASGMPAYVRLEAVRMDLAESIAAMRAGKIHIAAAALAKAAGRTLVSPRAMLSLLQPQTWKIIYTGQKLRAHAARRS
jgi:glycosyltransferase involved in cell wall biosynthesis